MFEHARDLPQDKHVAFAQGAGMSRSVSLDFSAYVPSRAALVAKVDEWERELEAYLKIRAGEGDFAFADVSSVLVNVSRDPAQILRRGNETRSFEPGGAPTLDTAFFEIAHGGALAFLGQLLAERCFVGGDVRFEIAVTFYSDRVSGIRFPEIDP